MSIKSARYMNEDIDKNLDEIFNGQTTITKEKLKQVLEEYRMKRGGRGGGRGGRGGRGGTDSSNPMKEEMRQKLAELLESELGKINSDSITKEQAKHALLSFGNQAKEQWHAQIDQFMQSSIQDEFKKLNVNEVNSNQARDLLRNVCHKMRPPHGSSSPMFDDRMKNDFITEFKNKYGTNKINVDEVWELMKNFDKKQNEKMNSPEANSEWEKEKEKKWDEIFNEQYKELFGDINKTKLNQQQLEELGKKIKEKLNNRPDCPQHPGKRFCQH